MRNKMVALGYVYTWEDELCIPTNAVQIEL